MELRQFEQLMQEAARFDAGWWKDDRRYWCAYCGIPTRRKKSAGTTQPPSLGTRDHVIPRAHNGGMVTIPACRACNAAKGAMSLPEYLGSAHFKAIRKSRHRHQWPLHELWAIVGIAALKRSKLLATETPPKTPEPNPVR